VSFPGLSTSAYAPYYVIGKSLKIFRGYHYTGISTATGVPQFEDVNKDGSLTSADYVTLGNFDPKYYGGLGNTFSYKGFSLDIFLQFSRQRGYNALRVYYYPVGYKVNSPAYLAQDNWTASHTNASQPGLTTTASSPTGAAFVYQLYASNAAFSDASYIRLKNLSFSYSLPQSLLKKAGVQDLRIYIQGQNLFTVTAYKALDPETQTATPVLKTLTGGIRLIF